MLDLKEIPLRYIADLNAAGYTDEMIRNMSARKLIDAWLIWVGIINYTTAIITVVTAAKAAEIK